MNHQLITRPRLADILAAVVLLSPAWVVADSPLLDEIVVTADFRARATTELPASISILDAETLQKGAVQHLEELLDRIPNLNWSGDGHRARHLQIRGIGELEQYQGAPNPSVGFVIDDIDFSGIGGVATLFDIDSVEVLRGSQGLRYGANALGGLVYMQSVLPASARSGRAVVTVADDSGVSIGAALGGAINSSETLLGRVSAQVSNADGFRRNEYLGRSDTNQRDEKTLRARLVYQPNDDLNVNLTMLYVDIDHGYDAFALDNSYNVLSDNPGKDAQESIGASLKLDWQLSESISLTSISAVADSEIEFGFDADWGNSTSWQPFTYDYESSSIRDRQTLSQELRLLGDSWIVGLYTQELSEQLSTDDSGNYFDPFFNFTDTLNEQFFSDFESSNISIFAVKEYEWLDAFTFSGGVRLENRDVDYVDSNSLRADPSETLWGGELSLRYRQNATTSWYTTLSKGFKAGGFNLGVTPSGNREYGGEESLTLEVGLKMQRLDGRLHWSLAAFSTDRSDQQVRTSTQLIPGDPASFVFFTDNIGRGETSGLESEFRWSISDEWRFYLNAGLLDATFDDGREQAHAPSYTVSTGIAYESSSGFFVKLDATAKDSYFFDVSHDEMSTSYELLHGRLGFEADTWTASLWVRNVFDEEYAVRGFYFGNEPPNFEDALYIRLGDPRHFGFTLEKRF